MPRRSSPSSSTAAINRLAVLLQHGLTLPQVQEAYLQGVDTVVWARAHGIYHLDPFSGAPLRFAGLVPDGFVDDYERMGRAGDPVFQHAVADRLPVDNSRILSEGDWRKAPVYDVLMRARLSRSLEAPLLAGDLLIGTLNLARTDDDPPFTAADLTRITLVSQQVEAALYRAIRFELTGRYVSLLEDILDRLPQALVVTRLNGETLFSNRAAERLATPRGRASPVHAIERAIRANIQRLEAEGGRVALLSTPAEDRSRQPYQAGETAAGTLVVKSVLLPHRHEAVVSFLYPRAAAARLPLTGTPLSAREQEIVELVSHGLSTREIAERACISEHTVKEHLKRIFGKLRVSSRAELVQAVWQTGARVQAEGASADDSPAALDTHRPRPQRRPLRDSMAAGER